MFLVDFDSKNWGFDPKNQFWLNLTGKTVFLTEQNWFWSILTEKIGFGRFGVNIPGFDQEMAFGRLWTKKLGFDRAKLLLIDFDQKNCFWLILAGKSGFGRF